MIDAMPPTEVANAERFERFGLDADAGVVARVRQEFTDWLRQFFTLDDVRRSDMVLAVNEALANAAEFAYVQSDRPGTIDFQAEYDAATQTLSVCVEDRVACGASARPNRPPEPAGGDPADGDAVRPRGHRTLDQRHHGQDAVAGCSRR